MSFLYSLTIKKKLILSYLSLVIVSIVLSWNSISNCLTNKDVAGFVHTTLSERYGRTRATADYALLLILSFKVLTMVHHMIVQKHL